jgi:hypothetical protein
MQFTEETFEQALNLFYSPDIIDLRDVSFIDPYGMVGILEIGELFQAEGIRKRILFPFSEEVLKYLERMDFFEFAGRYFILDSSASKLSEKFLRSTDSDVLLEITPIEKSDDIHFIVGKVKERAHSILERHLHYDDRAINGFIVALSEVCQNIIEHSQTRGFVGIQKYYWQNIKKNIVKIAVSDIGIGFRKSLSERFSLDSDVEAIEKALMHGVSRHIDKGRGHGLAAVKRFVNEWNGKLSVRSGTAKLAVLPEWGRGKRKETKLAYFPGAQINIVLPEV